MWGGPASACPMAMAKAAEKPRPSTRSQSKHPRQHLRNLNDKFLYINALQEYLNTEFPNSGAFGAKMAISDVSDFQTFAEQRQRSNRFRPLQCNGTGPFFPTSAAGGQRLREKKQRSARVLTRVLEDFL